MPPPPSARDKTLITMKRLLAVSASAAALSGACGNKEKGYGVVDPMPDPRQPCFDPLEKVVAYAHWATGDGGAPIIRVRIEIKQDAAELNFSQGKVRLNYRGGEVLRESATEKELVVEVTPPFMDGGVTESGEKTMDVRIDGLPCGEPMKTSSLRVVIDLSGPKDGSKLKTEVSIPPYPW
jgi:hypothetical protein